MSGDPGGVVQGILGLPSSASAALVESLYSLSFASFAPDFFSGPVAEASQESAKGVAAGRYASRS